MKAWRVHQYGVPSEVLQLDDVDEPDARRRRAEDPRHVGHAELQRPRRHPRPLQDRAAAGSVHPGHGSARHRRRLRPGRRGVARPACRRDSVGRVRRLRRVRRRTGEHDVRDADRHARSRGGRDLHAVPPGVARALRTGPRAAGRDPARARGRGRRRLGGAPARRARRRARLRDRGLAREDEVVPRARRRARDQLPGDRFRRGGARRDRRSRRRRRVRRGERRRDAADVPVHGLQRPAHPRRLRVGHRAGRRRTRAAAGAVRQLLARRRVPRLRRRSGGVQAAERVQLPVAPRRRAAARRAAGAVRGGQAPRRSSARRSRSSTSRPRSTRWNNARPSAVRLSVCKWYEGFRTA